MIPVEIGEPSLRRHLFNTRLNEESMLTSLDLVQEFWDQVRIWEEASKLRVQRRYNTKVKPWSFHQGDLVLRMASAARKHEGSSPPTRKGHSESPKLWETAHIGWSTYPVPLSRPLGTPHISSFIIISLSSIYFSDSFVIRLCNKWCTISYLDLFSLRRVFGQEGFNEAS